jgi:hypothetical protein
LQASGFAVVPVQALPSEHAVPFARFVYLQPLAGRQESLVQGLLSLQTRLWSLRQCPAPSQVSGVVQALPSVHGAPSEAG